MNVLSKTQEELLVGALLGDGCVFLHPNAKHPYFYIARKLTDIQYLEYQFQFFRSYCNQSDLKQYDIYDKRTKKTYQQVKFVTRSNVVFDKYYQEWYSGVKRLPEKLELSPLTCAIWFCDDGCVCLDKRTNRLKLKLSTHCFTEHENKRLSHMLYQMLDTEHFAVSQDGGNYYITSADSGTKAFIRYIQNYIPVSMQRKITWNENHFKQSKSASHLKNRGEYYFSEREKQILGILIHGSYTPKSIAIQMHWTNSANKTPSGLTMYLNRFLDNQLVSKHGTKHSYKNPMTYSLTTKGLAVCKKLSIMP